MQTKIHHLKYDVYVIKFVIFAQQRLLNIYQLYYVLMVEKLQYLYLPQYPLRIELVLKSPLYLFNRHILLSKLIVSFDNEPRGALTQNLIFILVPVVHYENFTFRLKFNFSFHNDLLIKLLPA